MNARLSAVLFGSAAAGVALLALLDAAAKGVVLLAVAWVVALAMRRAPASARHLVWLAALGCALVLPVCSWALPGWHVLPAWMRWETVRAAVVRVPDAPVATNVTYVPALEMPAAPVVAQSQPVSPPAPRLVRAVGFLEERPNFLPVRVHVFQQRLGGFLVVGDRKSVV